MITLSHIMKLFVTEREQSVQ